MRRIKMLALAVALGSAFGGALGVRQVRAQTLPGDQKYVCLHSPSDPDLCAPTWMHTCWC